MNAVKRIPDAAPVRANIVPSVSRFIRRSVYRTEMENALGRGYDHAKALVAILEPDEQDRVEPMTVVTEWELGSIIYGVDTKRAI